MTANLATLVSFNGSNGASPYGSPYRQRYGAHQILVGRSLIADIRGPATASAGKLRRLKRG
jgi:hypothetical protein